MEWIIVGKLGRPHGIRGALKLIHFGDAQLQPEMYIKLERKNGTVLETSISEVAGNDRFHVQDIGDRTEAELWTHAQVSVRREDLPLLDEDEYYLVDIIGSRVLQSSSEGESTELGTLVGFNTQSPQTLAEVKTPAGQVVLVPWVDAIVIDVDIERMQVELDPPLGLFDA